jgi:UDP-N-acetylmuramate--alanine ligase
MAEKNFSLKPDMHIHLVGIGGSGISAIARVLLARNFTVSGSDQNQNEMTAALQKLGATIYVGHQAAHIAGADACVISSAVPSDNPELLAAAAAGIPVLKRADFLGPLMAGQIGIAIAGSHGKTTTTGMIAQILLRAEKDPSLIVGAVFPSLETNGRYGEGDYFIIEADEYDHMFLGLDPEVAVITNIEHDHPDIFPDDAAYQDAFRQFAQRLPEGGNLIVCIDDPGVRALLQHLPLSGREITTYSIIDIESGPAADYRALDLRDNQLGGTDFLVETEEQMIGLARLRVPGEHNVQNALAAIIVALDLGIDFNVIRSALAEFNGMSRRFQVIAEVENVTIIDDYAHHPTEIEVTLKAARQRFPGRRIWAVWQPHTYSRTRLLRERFTTCFQQADRVVALDIYHSRETNTLGIDTSTVLNNMAHNHAVHIPDQREAADYILDRILPYDVVLTLGAGDGHQVGQWIIEGLREKK